MTLLRFNPRISAVCVSLGLVALTGCGGTTDASGAGDGQIASLQTDGETDTSGETDGTEDAAVSADEAALEFSQCLRDQGLDVADIGVDADGNIDMRSAFESVEPGDGEFQTAMEACSDILGDVGFGGGARGGDFDDTALQDAFLEFSDCVRDQGFEDIPDLSFQAPGGGRPGGGEIGEGGPPADGSIPPRGEGQRPEGFGDRNTIFAEGLGLDPDDPAVIAALDECSPLVEGAFGGPGGVGSTDGDG